MPVLIVDDDESVRDALGRLLANAGYRCTLAASTSEARARLSDGAFAIALVDVMMPGETGIDLLSDLTRHPDLAPLMLTGVDDPSIAELALDRGAYGYFVKPLRPNQVLIGVANAARRRCLEIENRRHRNALEALVLERTAALQDSIAQLREVEGQVRMGAEHTVEALARAIEHRDEETSAHVQRMSRYAELLARGFGWRDDECALIRTAAAMHDVGKVGVPDGILFKPGRLSDSEFDVIKEHAARGAEILGMSDTELLTTAAAIARTHHERWDGTGYPDGLAGTEIPIEGRIAAVADVFDAVVSRRVYKAALSNGEAIEVLSAGRGTQFDADVVDVFLASMGDVLEIQQRYRDP
jgi:putative two-component system response regulator